MRIHPTQPKFNDLVALSAYLVQLGDGAVEPLYSGGFAFGDIASWWWNDAGTIQRSQISPQYDVFGDLETKLLALGDGAVLPLYAGGWTIADIDSWWINNSGVVEEFSNGATFTDYDAMITALTLLKDAGDLTVEGVLVNTSDATKKIGTVRWSVKLGVFEWIGPVYPKNVTDSVMSLVTLTGGSSLGAEIHTASNAAADPNGSEANATTGFVMSPAVGSTLSSEVADPDTGTWHIRGTVAPGNIQRFIKYDFTSVVGVRYLITYAARKGGAGNGQLVIVSLGTDNRARANHHLTASWVDYAVVIKANAISAAPTWHVTYFDINGGYVDIDNLSIKAITGTVNVITVADASSFSEGDNIQIWDTINSVEVAGGREITNITVNAITFNGAAVVVAPYDAVYKEGINELGEAGSNWSPQHGKGQGGFIEWSDGLKGVDSSCTLDIVSSGGKTRLAKASITASIDATASGALKKEAKLGFGWSTPTFWLSALIEPDPTDEDLETAFDGALNDASFVDRGTIGTADDIRLSLSYTGDDQGALTGNGSVQVSHANLNAAAPHEVTSAADTSFALSTSGPITGLRFTVLSLEGAAALTATLKEFTARFME